MAAIGNARPARGRRPARQDTIMQIGRKARQQTQNGPGGMLGDRGFGGPSRAPVKAGGRFGRAAVAGAGGGRGGEGGGRGVQLGAQLQRRVKSGAIDPQQAQRTARQRQTLTAAFGDNFRQKLGGPGVFNKLRQELSKNPNNPRLQQRNQTLLQKRSQLLQAAQERLAAGTATGARRPAGAGRGRPNPAGRGLLNPPGQDRPTRPRRRRVAPARPAY